MTARQVMPRQFSGIQRRAPLQRCPCCNAAADSALTSLVHPFTATSHNTGSLRLFLDSASPVQWHASHRTHCKYELRNVFLHHSTSLHGFRDRWSRLQLFYGAVQVPLAQSTGEHNALLLCLPVQHVVGGDRIHD